MTIKDTLQKIDRYMAAIRAYRPLSEAEVRELDAYYKMVSPSTTRTTS